MRVLICGGRNYADREAIWSELDKLLAEHQKLTVIQGKATGADHLAREWTHLHPEVKLVDEPARWNDLSHPDAVIRTRADGTRYDAKAGPRRNAKMLREYKPEIVLAFPGQAGTQDMISKAKRAGVKVVKAGKWVQ